MDRAAPTFEEWVEDSFGKAAPDRAGFFPEVFVPASAPGSAEVRSSWPGGALLAQHLARLFEAPSFLAERYTGQQLRDGFYYIARVDSYYLAAARQPHVPIDLQLRWVAAIGDLYEKLFAAVCSEHLSHLDERPAHPLNAPVYMFWDLDVIEGAAIFPDEQKSHHLIEPIFRVLERALSLPSIACQESALHGLGHLVHYHPGRAEPIIKRFLDRSSGLRPELLKYASCALVGGVQ